MTSRRFAPTQTPASNRSDAFGIRGFRSESASRSASSWGDLIPALILLVALALLVGSGCASERLSRAQLRDISRLSIEYVSITDARLPESGIDGEAGAAIQVGKPLWLGGFRFFQTGVKLSAAVGMAGTTAMYSAASINVGADMHMGRRFSFRTYMGPYMGTQYLAPGHMSTVGLYYYNAYSFAIGRDPRDRVLLGVLMLMPFSGVGSASVSSCPNDDECAPQLGFTLGYEGMFL